jgi:GNAT superfamily N-acetyltransferase
VESQYEARQVTADVIRPLRHAVLRPGKPWASAFYPHDEDPLSGHFAVMSHGPAGRQLLAVGSILPDAPSWPNPSGQGSDEGAAGSDVTGFAWRIRGMAARFDMRSKGLGGLVLTGLISHAQSRPESQPDGLLWFTARIQAVAFYERFGFVTRGGIGRVPGLGPHITMWRLIFPEE